MRVAVASGVGASPEEILVCQTGLIGIPFPLEAVHPHVRRHRRGPRPVAADAGAAAARAIMTTDTVAEGWPWSSGPGSRSGAMAKGAAMLAPNMATMLAAVHHRRRRRPGDAPGRAARRRRRRRSTRMTVDGCTSTNDTVLVLASGRGAEPSLATL